MQLRNSSDGYGAIARAFHWLTVVLVLLAWTLGTFGDVFPKGAARTAGLMVHISAGLTILAVLLARLLWRLVDRPPAPEPTRLGLWADRAGRLAHIALYALLFAIPVSGIVVQFARGNALPLFGLFEIASPWLADRASARAVKEVHELLANALGVLAALHAIAALYHHWVLRDRTLLRMLPR
ncbi:MAG TPA: cytochrome b [Tardiphaga sp.]